MIQLAIIRHGHTSWNRAGRIQGHTDIPLEQEAEETLARYCLPDKWHTAMLVSSPLSRAKRTAELIGGRKPEIAGSLIEMNWGAWEGVHHTDLCANADSGFKSVDHWGWDFRPPGGESPRDLRCRLEPWWRSLRSDTVAVCHIGIMRVLLAVAHDWNFSGPLPFEIKRNRLYILNVGTDLEVAHPAQLPLVSAE